MRDNYVSCDSHGSPACSTGQLDDKPRAFGKAAVQLFCARPVR